MDGARHTLPPCRRVTCFPSSLQSEVGSRVSGRRSSRYTDRDGFCSSLHDLRRAARACLETRAYFPCGCAGFLAPGGLDGGFFPPLDGGGVIAEAGKVEAKTRSAPTRALASAAVSG